MQWVIALTFVVCAVLMYRRMLPALLALPLMALVIALAAQPGQPLEALALVFGKGSTRLAGAMSNAIFGAVLAHVVAASGAGEAIVRGAAELAGERPFTVALILFAATALAFLALTGLGAAIMVGTIVLPILTGVGFTPVAATGVFLLGVSLGGAWNLANWGLFRDTLDLAVPQIAQLAAFASGALALAALVYIYRHSRQARVYATAAEPPESAPPPARRVPVATLFTPLVPVVVLLGAKAAGVDLDINAALVLGILWGALTSAPRALNRTLSQAVVEGVRDVAPVLWLLMAIGMVVTSLSSDLVRATMVPLMDRLVPSSAWGYVLVFGLASPLALYRGPLNLYGLGAGLAPLLAAGMGGPLAGGALMSAGQVQGVCDPTNTHNAWAAGFAGCDVNDVLRSTLPYAWAASAVALVLVAMVHGV